MRFNIKRCLIILLSCIFIPLSVLSSGNSNWYVLNQTSKEQTTMSNSLSTNAGESVTTNGTTISASSNAQDPVFVDFYYWTSITTTSPTQSTKIENVSGKKGLISSEKAITLFGDSVMASAICESYKGASESSPKTYSQTIEETSKDGITTKIITKNQIVGTESSSRLGTTTYTIYYRVDTITQTIKEDLVRDANNNAKVFHTSQTSLNNTITPPSLTYNNYTLIGFYNNKDNAPSTEFDFSKPITTNDVNTNRRLAVIVQWSSQPETGYDSGYTSLTDTVNSLTSTLDVNASSGYDLAKDFTYSPKSSTLLLGKTNTETTIKSGATLNLCMNNGAYQYQATEGSTISDVEGNQTHSVVGDDYFASLDYTGKTKAAGEKNVANPCDYTIRLQNNLTIKGKLNLGGYTGATVSGGFSPQGSIIGNYVKLDLNGYTITIENGGILHSFGYITDSVGTGKLIVKAGGHLYSQMVIASLKGGNSTLWSYAKGVSPFENYYFPYLDTEVEIQATSSGAGNFTAYTKLNLGNLGFTNMYFPIIGGSSNYMFYVKAKSSTNGAVRLTRTEVEELNVAPFTYQDLKKNCLDFENVDATFNAPNVDVIASMDLSSYISLLGKYEFPMTLELNRIIFPISSFLDMNFYSSTFTLSQKIQVLPGASIMLDENSELVLGHSNGKVTFEDKTVKVSVTLLTFKKIMPGESKYLSGGILAMDNDPIENSQYVGAGYDLNSSNTTTKLSYIEYWNKVFESATVNIYGNIKFMTGNASEAPYTLAGNINVNTFSTSSDTTKKAWNTQNLATLSGVYFNSYDLNIYSGIFYWFGTSDITSESNTSAYSAAIRFYALPMISNGVAYLHNSTTNLQGSYNSKTGIFTSGNESYFFKANNSLLTTSSQESAIDYTLTPTKCSIVKDCLITAGSQSYAYFGGLYFPITSENVTANTTSVTANLQKFSSDSAYVAEKTLTYQNGYWKIA